MQLEQMTRRDDVALARLHRDVRVIVSGEGLQRVLLAGVGAQANLKRKASMGYLYEDMVVWSTLIRTLWSNRQHCRIIKETRGVSGW